MACMGKVQIKILMTISIFVAVFSHFFNLGLPTLDWPNDRGPASGSRLDSIINMVTLAPFGSRFNDYIEALGVKKTGAGNRGSNPGLITFNDGLIKGNRCFADLAAQFYTELQILDLIKTQRNSTSITSIESLLKSKRATLLDSLDKNTSPQAGFLWDLAIKYADGDSNLAMHLIGLCGHDDVSVELSLPENQNTGLQEKKENILKQLDKSVPPEVAQYLRFRTSKPQCPFSTSPIYYPGALGSDYDIPKSLKEKIIQNQSPTLGGKALPAKSYHVMGGALATCLLIQRGIPSFVVRQVHKKATNAYRSTTSCSNIKKSLSLYSEKEPKAIQLQKELSEFIILVKKNPGLCTTPDRNIYQIFCNIFSNSEIHISSDLVLNRIETAFSKADAVFLLNRTAAGKSSIENCNRIDLSSQLESALEHTENEKCLTTWSQQRCDKAKLALRGWIVDFEWTRSQHLVGESFASDHCTNVGNHDRLEHSCTAFKNLETNLRNNKRLQEYQSVR